MAGVYISYPFCARKCTFCNFASGVFARGIEERYIDALCAEIAGFRWQWVPETVYIGGGTPSRMGAEALARVLVPVPGRPWREATIEAAPGGITREQAEAWHDAGINRVSLGVQSFVDSELAGTGRTHNAAAVARDVETLRAAGITNFNIDLIAGLPRQTAAGWEESLRWVERLEAPHVSVYMLEVDEDSRLGAEILRGGTRYGAAQAPGEEQVVGFYERAIERLERAGIRQYEISNFARPGFESVHNLKYWRLEPYVGFGADAHSFDVVPNIAHQAVPMAVPAAEPGSCGAGSSARVGVSTPPRAPNPIWSRDLEGAVGALSHNANPAGLNAPPQAEACPPQPVVPGQSVRRRNPESVQDYLAGAPAIETPATPEERFFVGLRLREGVRITEQDRALHAETIARYTALGLLEEHAGMLRLTRRGILLSNEIFQDFIP